MALSLKLLGEFEIRDEVGTVLLLPTRKTRALLGYLAVNAERPQPRERLMALLWSDRSERQARQSLNQALLSIRKLGGAAGHTELLDSDGERVTLRGKAVECDVQRLRSLAKDDPLEAAALYDGPFLDGLSVPDPAFEEWLLATRSAFHALVCDALETVANLPEDIDTAIGCAKRLVALDPLREDAHRRLMQLLHKSGDRAGALRQYQVCVDILKRELQVDPDAATTALLEEIRRDHGSESNANFLSTTPQAPALPDKPSIAVLAFDNMSGDPEQDYFGDGMAEDIITALSRYRSLFVIARSSSFTYKGRSIDVTDIARELGVRYVVEGSVRKANNRVRVTAQLIDATSGVHLWADRFEGDLGDVFNLQDQITEQIVVAVEPEILARERERARRKQPGSLDAWELLQRGLSHFYRVNQADRAEAIRLFKEAADRDPDFAMAHAYLGFVLWASRSVTMDDAEDAGKAAAAARAAAKRAVSLDPNEPMAHFALGRLHIFAGEPEMAIAEMKSAIAINPNYARGEHGLGFAYSYAAGRHEQSLPHFEAALRLSPRDPLRWAMLMTMGSVLRVLGRYDEAIAVCQQACQFPDAGFLPHVMLATALAEAGNNIEAQAAAQKAMQLQPALSISFVRRHFPGIHETTLNSLLDGLRKVNVPE